MALCESWMATNCCLLSGFVDQQNKKFPAAGFYACFKPVIADKTSNRPVSCL